MSEYILKTTNLTKTYKGYHAVNTKSGLSYSATLRKVKSRLSEDVWVV